MSIWSSHSHSSSSPSLSGQQPVRTARGHSGGAKRRSRSGAALYILTSSMRLSMPKRVNAVIASSPGPRTVRRPFFGVHFVADILQPIGILAEHLGDAGDGEDV